MTATARDPHAPYIEAVVSAMTGVPAPTRWWVSDSETGEDGETMTLSAVLEWDDDASPAFPYGLILCWDLDREWQCAPMCSDGSNESPEDLPLSLWAAPDDVAAVAAAVLRSEPLPRPKLPPWADAEVLAAVQEWVEP